MLKITTLINGFDCLAHIVQDQLNRDVFIYIPESQWEGFKVSNYTPPHTVNKDGVITGNYRVVHFAAVILRIDATLNNNAQITIHDVALVDSNKFFKLEINVDSGVEKVITDYLEDGSSLLHKLEAIRTSIARDHKPNNETIVVPIYFNEEITPEDMVLENTMKDNFEQSKKYLLALLEAEGGYRFKDPDAVTHIAYRNAVCRVMCLPNWLAFEDEGYPSDGTLFDETGNWIIE